MKASAALIAGVSAAIIAIGLLFAYMGAANTGNGFEKSIKAAHMDSQNVLGQLAPKLREALGVTKLQTEAVVAVVTAGNETRYGEGGSTATMQWIKEQNPNLDQSTYGKVINMIEGARNDFAKAQTMKIDRVRSYETALGNQPGAFFMSLAGYPTADYKAANYDKIVISDHANDAFTTGIDNGIDIN